MMPPEPINNPLRLYWKNRDQDLRFPADLAVIYLGRDPHRCYVPILGSEDAPFIGRCHVQFAYDYQDQTWSVRDFRSALGTSVNGVALTAMVPHVLSQGDVIQLAGRQTFIFTENGSRIPL